MFLFGTFIDICSVLWYNQSIKHTCYCQYFRKNLLEVIDLRIDRIKFAVELTRADITILELSKRSGVSRMTISAVRGGKSCKRETAEKIAAGLGVSLDRLLRKEAC